MKKLLILSLLTSSMFAGGYISSPENIIQKTNQFDLKTFENNSLSEDYHSKFNFIGASITSSSIDFTDNTSQKDALLGIRYGIQNTNWRTFSEIKFDWRNNYTVTLETDKLFIAYKIESLTIAPYIGASIGYLEHTKDDDDEHAVFGLHSGLIFNLNDTMDLDLSLSKKRKRDFENVDKIISIGVSLHYFF